MTFDIAGRWSDAEQVYKATGGNLPTPSAPWDIEGG
jgi:hypothetical protein